MIAARGPRLICAGVVAAAFDIRRVGFPMSIDVDLRATTIKTKKVTC
jgi:hypothetical protein